MWDSLAWPKHSRSQSSPFLPLLQKLALSPAHGWAAELGSTALCPGAAADCTQQLPGAGTAGVALLVSSGFSTTITTLVSRFS